VDQEKSVNHRGMPPREADLRTMLEERSRNQDAVWNQRSKVARWLLLGLTVAVVGGLACWTDMRNAIIDVIFPPAANSAAAPADSPQDAMQALAQKAAEQQAPLNDAARSLGAPPEKPAESSHALSPGDLHLAKEVMQFLQTGGSQPPPKQGQK